MRFGPKFAIVLTALTAGQGFAQHAQPYAGLETRAIKALSNEQIADLRTGRGMGLALAAELNGYPGPRHVLELADPLGLSEGQLAEIEALFGSMKAETILIGERLIAQEAELDQEFAERTITPESLNTLTDAIGETEAALKAAHLRYHLSTLAALTSEQVDRYMELRGYAAPRNPERRHDQHSSP
jgi:hypothetical protein